MNYLLNLVSAVSPAPDQEDGLRPGLDPSQVTPGLLGFLATLALVIAVIFLVRDMSRRIRRVRYQGMGDEQPGSDRPETLLDDDSVTDGGVPNGGVPNGGVPNGGVKGKRVNDGGVTGKRENNTQVPDGSDTRPGSSPGNR